MSTCAFCDEDIRQNEHAVHCSSCGSWRHRRCSSGITKRQYLDAQKRGLSVPYVCGDCQYRTALQAGNETLLSDTDDVRFFECRSVARGETVDIQEEARSNLSSTEDLENKSISGVESETSLAEPSNDDVEERYQIVPGGSSKGRDVLIDRWGYQYTRKPCKTSNKPYWRCVVRKKEQNCRASVIESDGVFTRGIREHVHEPTSGSAQARRISSRVKEVAKANVFQSAADIAEEVIVEELTDEPYPQSLASVANVARAANRHRRLTRPKHPTDLAFELKTQHIPANFLQGDIRVGNERHLVFATGSMLKQLEKAKTWYVHGTIKVAQKPFYQLFSIHAFLKQDKVIKQVPLCFAIMSAKREEDYKALFELILKRMSRLPRVENVVSDFERAIWKAVKKALPAVKHRGCNFEWTKAIKTQMKANTGLYHLYRRKQGHVYHTMREILALPYLPATKIESLFDGKLKSKLELLGFKGFSDYLRKMWIKRWSPSSWSVYQQAIRTNNDCEGWHCRLNRKTRNGNLNLYLLIHLLHNESKMVSITMKMISDRKLCSSRKKNSRTKDARLHAYWKKFDDGNMEVEDLLRACTYIPRWMTKNDD